MSESGSDEDSVVSGDVEYNRLNRWSGAPRTWQKYTEHERGLAASLDQIRNSDLSLHLYNAHALKQRAKEYSENPQTARVNQEHPGVPEADRTFKPPKSWTAWPLPPGDVPREGDKVGSNDPYESYTLKRKQVPWPSRELEEVLMSAALKFAKERFERRMSESEREAELQEELEAVPEGVAIDDNNDLSAEPLGKLQNMVIDPNDPSNEQMKPTISLDDERSWELLRPSIRHTLSKLDDVFMALHHARMACRQYSQSDAATTDEDNTTKNDNEAKPKRPRGRPRKFADLPDRSRGREHTLIQDNDDELLRFKKTHRGRPQKVYERLDGESQQDYIVRIARLQKKPLPSFAPSQSAAALPPPSNLKASKSKSPRMKTTPEELRLSWQKRLGLRDWSEVLGAAALIGFSPEVISRATQRCASLFDEGMDMRSIVEKPFSEKEPDFLTRYVPERIPDLDTFESQPSTSDDFENSNISASETDSKVKAKQRRTTKTPGRVSCFCPIAGCWRRLHGFRDKLSLKRHLQKAHKICPSEIDEYVLPSDEEMDGAVHVDGFMKPIHTYVTRQRKPREKHGTKSSKSGADIAGSASKVTNPRQTSPDSDRSSGGWSSSE